MKFETFFLNECRDTISSLDISKISKMVRLISDVKKRKGRIFFVGVGGSAANASHAVNDFRKLGNIECYTPADNMSEISARINDDGWNSAYKKWLEVSKFNKHDMLFVFSVGGGDLKKKISVNIIEAIKLAMKKKAKICSIVGPNGGYAKKYSHVSLVVLVKEKKFVTPISESIQSIIWHLLVSHALIKENKTKW